MNKFAHFINIIMVSVFLGITAQGCGQNPFDKRRSNRIWTTSSGHDDGRMPMVSTHDAVELKVFVNYQNGSYGDYVKMREILKDPDFITQCERVKIRLVEIGLYDNSFDVLIQFRQPYEIPNQLGNAEYWHWWHGDNVGDINMLTGMDHELIYEVLLHEVGHCIGAAHSNHSGDVMTTHERGVYKWSDYEAERIAAFANGELPPREESNLNPLYSHWGDLAWNIEDYSYSLHNNEEYKFGRLAINTFNRYYVSDYDRERGKIWISSLYFYAGLLNAELIPNYDEIGNSTGGIIVKVEGEPGQPVYQNYYTSDERHFALNFEINLVGQTRFKILYKGDDGRYVEFETETNDTAKDSNGHYVVSMIENEDESVSLSFD